MLRPLPSPKAAPGEEEIERVVHASTASSTDGVYEQMEKIRASALRHNRAERLHAVLLYQSGWFVHWAEGPPAALRLLLERVRNDTRHHSPRLLHHSRGRRFLPTTWSMMLSPSTEPAALFARRVHELRERFEQGHQFAPTSVIRRLSAPIRLAQAQRLPDPEAFHRVGVVSAGTTEAFDLVRWLARQHSAYVVSRRFAGEDDHDGGSDYVEWMEGNHPCRVIAVARQGLLHGLRRVFLPDWPHLMLLFSGEPRRDDPLMDRVRLACNNLPLRPVLVGCAPDVATQARMAQAARADGLTYLNAGLMLPQDSAAVWHTMREQLLRAGPPPSSAWALPDDAPAGF